MKRRQGIIAIATVLLTFVSLLQSLSLTQAQAATTGSGNCVQTVNSTTGVTVTESGTDCIVTFNVSTQTTAVTNSWTAPANVTAVRVLIVGGGASGDRGHCNVYFGHGGGGGQVRELVLPVTPATSSSIAVGNGGAAPTGSCSSGNGNPGGDSSFGSFTSAGGRIATYNLFEGGASGLGLYRGEYSGYVAYKGGAGGGAGGPGGTSSLKGGIGVNSTITDSTVMYGSGGTGTDGNTANAFAYSGGGTNLSYPTDNRGGGGSDMYLNSAWVAGPGAAGTVIIRYRFVASCLPSTSTNDSMTVLKFTNVGTCNWQVPAQVSSVRTLLVGGGGGGGTWVAGGGGGGGVVDQTVSVTAGNTYPIDVAVGGLGTLASGFNSSMLQGTNGDASTAFGLTAYGGGLGASYNSYVTGSLATGGGAATTTGTGSTYNVLASISPAQGFAGGTPVVNATYGYPAGGGGGAGGFGGNAVVVNVTSSSSGNGGAAMLSTFTGSNLYFGAGGGGGCHGSGSFPCTHGTGTNGGGNGTGWTTDSTTGNIVTASDGTANTGGGGGGAGTPYARAWNHAQGGNGGTGIVIVMYQTPLINSSTTISLAAGGLVYRQSRTLTAVANATGKITFKVNGKRLSGCISKVVNSTNSYTATCSYRPSLHGFITVTAEFTPTGYGYFPSSATSSTVYVSARVSTR